MAEARSEITASRRRRVTGAELVTVSRLSRADTIVLIRELAASIGMRAILTNSDGLGEGGE